MKASKVIALAGLSVLTFNFALKLATDSLLVPENDETAAIAAAPAKTPGKILAPATATPGVAEETDSVDSTGTWGDDSPPVPDLDFGQANPAHGEPAWGAAERARQATASATEEPSVGGHKN